MSANLLAPKGRKLTAWSANPRNSHKTPPSAWPWALFTRADGPDPSVCAKRQTPNAKRRTPLATLNERLIS